MPIYTAHLTRKHKTETRALKPPTPDMEPIARPVTAYEKVVIDYSEPISTADEYAAFRSAVVCKAAPSDPAWHEWHLHSALVNGECPPPPAMLTPDKSPAMRAINKQANQYLTLYRNDAYTPFRVIEHWFCTIGNAMAWDANGHYVSRSRHKQTKRDREDDENHVAVAAYAFIQDHRPKLSDEVSLYPLSEQYSDIFNVPQNVEDSFLLAAIDLCNYYLSRPTRFCLAYNPFDHDRELNPDDNTWQAMVMTDATKYREKLEAAYAEIWNIFDDRLKALGVEKVDYVRDDTPHGQFVPGDRVWADRQLTPEQLESRKHRARELLSLLKDLNM